jgi:hypothetical protein
MRTDDAAERSAGIARRRDGRTAGADNLLRVLEEASDLEADRRGRHRTEMRQHRIAPADGRIAEEDLAEAILDRGLLQLGTRIGNGDEMTARRLDADRVRHAFEEILLQDVRLEGLPDLLATMTSVRGRSSLCSRALISAGSVESSTCNVG